MLAGWGLTKPDDLGAPARAGRPGAAERAHLREPGETSHTTFRYPPPPDLREVVRRFWVPVWSVPSGQASVQKVLQHPVCLLVVTPTSARFYGVTSGLSRTTLTGEGWAVGVMLTPAAGYLLTGTSLEAYVDRTVDLEEILGASGGELRDGVREAMAGDPSERALQRLVRRRVGLTPKWLIQRRRLHEVVELVRESSMSHAELAAALGYADQAHLVRDFSRVTGTTPGAFAAAQRQPSQTPGP